MTSTTRLLRPLGLAALCALAVASPAAHADDKGSWLQRIGVNTVTGSGTLKSETRPLSGFRAVALRSAVKVQLRQGGQDAVAVQADDNLLALVETRIADHGGVPTLEIDTRRGTSYTSRHPIIVSIDVTNLAALSISGSGDIEGEGLKSAALTVSVMGSGDVKLTQLHADDVGVKVSGSGDVAIGGRAAKLSLAIVGSGDIDTAELDADEVKVSISGSGDATVAANKTLQVSIAGSGDVRYTGNAAVQSNVAGSGSVKKR